MNRIKIKWWYINVYNTNEPEYKRQKKTKQHLQSYKELDRKQVFEISPKSLQRTERETILLIKW